MNLYLFRINLILAFFLAFIFLFILPLIFFFTRKKTWLYLYICIYVLLLILGVFSDISIDNNHISFSLLITHNWGNKDITIAYFGKLSVIINTFLLFPLGFIAPLTFNKKQKIHKTIIYGLIFSFTIELFQFILPIVRYPEVLDVLTNTISVILGYIYYLIIEKILNRGESNDKLSKQKNCN